MTLRAILLGLFGAALICGVSYFNDAVIHQTYLVGNNMPFFVYGILVLFALVLNPLLGRLSQRVALSGREMAVVLALALAACCIPGSGLMRTFPSSLVLPHHYAQTEAGWRDQGVLGMAPEAMLVRVTEENSSVVLNGFIQGLGVGDRHVPLSDIPWSAWAPALTFWLPVVLAFWIALVGLSLVVHKQWADHEQLPYPIAQFANSLLPGEDGTRAAVFGNRLFWLGAAVMLAIHTNNYVATWFPNTMVQVPLGFNFGTLSRVFETLDRGGGWFAFRPQLYPTVIAFSFFLAADVSLSLGLGPYIYATIAGLFLSAGISLAGGGYLGLKPQTFLNFGAYFGLFLGLLYTGRYYYLHTLRRAVFLKGSADVASYAVWGMRVFLAGFVGFVACLSVVGLDWQLAVLYAGGAVMIFLVMARMLSETGLFFMQPYTFPCVVIWGVFGAQALGPETLLILLMLTTVLLVDPRESLMPFVVNSLKTVDLRAGQLGKTACACALALIVGLTVVIPVQLYLQYDRGSNMADGWASRVVPMLPFEEAVRVKQRLIAQEALDGAEAIRGWDRVARMSPEPGLVAAFASGLGLVVLFTACRLRFPKWPFHPVMFLIWNSYPGKAFAASFLVGSFIKALVTKYGGPVAYRKLKPLMFGIIAGELLGALLPSLVGAVYYFATGDVPKSFRVFPG